MADFTSTVEIVFGIVDNLSSGINKISNNTAELAGNLETATQPLADLTGNLLKFEAAVLAAGGAVIGFALDAAVKTETAFTELSKVAGATVDELQENFGPRFKEISAEYGVSLDEVIRSTADFQQAGFNAAESIDLLDSSLKAAVITELNAAQAAELLVQITKGFGSSTKDAAFQLDVLNEISNNAAVNAGTLGQSIAVLAPFVQGLGFSFEETAAFLTPVLEKFQDGTRSARGLQIAFANLATQGTKEIREEFERLGVVTTDANGELLSGKEILENLRPAFQNLTEAQKVQTGEIIAGASQVGRFIALMEGLGTATDGTARANVILTTALEAGGSAQREFDVFAQQTAFTLSQISATIGVLFTDIGQKLLPGFKNLATAALELAQGLQSSFDDGAFDALLDPLLAGFNEAAEVLSGIAGSLPEAFAQVDFTPVVNALGTIRDAFAGLFDGLDLTNPEDLAEVIQTVVDGFANLTELSGQVLTTFATFAGELVPIIEGFTELEGGALKAAAQVLAYGTALNVASGFASTALVSFAAVTTGIASLPGAVAVAGPALGKLAGAFTAANIAAAGFVGVAAGAGLLIGNLAGDAIDALVNALTDSEESLGTWIAEITGAGESSEKFAQALSKIEIDALLAGLRSGAISAEEFAKQTGLSVDAAERLAGATQEAKVAVRDYDAEVAKAVETSNAKAEADKAQAAALEAVAEQLRLSGTFYEVVNGAVQKATQESVEFGDELAENLELFKQIGETTGEYAKRLGEAGAESKDITDEITGLNSKLKEELDLTVKVSDGLVEYSGFQKDAADASKKAAEETEKQTKAANDLKAKLEEIASDERLKALEIRVSLDIAKLEADSQALSDVLSAVETSVQSTGDVIGSALGALGEVGGFFGLEQLEIIERQLEIENKRRQEALDLQTKLTEAQIENIEARTDAIKDGEALIKIEGDGLEPELEAFMFKILKKIQLRASQEGAEFLLGVGV